MIILLQLHGIHAFCVIVSELLDEKKYNDIADRITRKKELELKREKFFYTQALKTIETSLGSDEGDYVVCLGPRNEIINDYDQLFR